MKEAVIVSTARTPVGRANRGSLATVRPDDLAAIVIKASVDRVNGFDPSQVDDVIIGCAFPEGEQGMNVTRLALLRAGLPDSVPGQTVNRFCSSGLQTISTAAQSIMTGFSKAIVAGGTESMSMVPMTTNKFSPNPWLSKNYPEAYLRMGLTAENLVDMYNISREEQDQFSLESHQKAAAAQDAGKFDDELVPVPIELVTPDGIKNITLEYDEGPRRDTSMKAMARLRPAFKQNGTVTAANSSQMSDGAAAVMVMEREYAESLGLTPLVRFVSYAVAGVPPDIMGIGPVKAIPKALNLAGLDISDIGVIELNEAFAAQSLAVIKEADLDTSIINVNGGAIALGHPLGCTGAKLTVQIIHEMIREKHRYGMVTMCIGGGMGAAGIFENLEL